MSSSLSTEKFSFKCFYQIIKCIFDNNSTTITIIIRSNYKFSFQHLQKKFHSLNLVFCCSWTWHFYISKIGWIDEFLTKNIFDIRQLPEIINRINMVLSDTWCCCYIQFIRTMCLSFYCQFLVLTRIITRFTIAARKKKSFILHLNWKHRVIILGNKFLYCALFNL